MKDAMPGPFRLYSRKFLFLVMGLYLGIGVILLDFMPRSTLSDLIVGSWPTFLGGLIMVFCVLEMVREMKIRRTSSFQDVDRKEDRENGQLDIVLSRLRDLESSNDKIDYDKIAAMVAASVKSPRPHLATESLADFRSYFATIVSIIEHKANIADEKASILLDKGTAYSRYGIFFFLISIIGWQLLAWFKAFEVQMIYGILSCSFLFAFIEFLSAWFLRQYRHFVDTSTYLIKVKSIFDRYLLTFLALERLDGNQDAHKSTQFDKLAEILREDIRWPDDHIFTRGDVSFAKEALQSASLMIQAARKNEARDKN